MTCQVEKENEKLNAEIKRLGQVVAELKSVIKEMLADIKK